MKVEHELGYKPEERKEDFPIGKVAAGGAIAAGLGALVYWMTSDNPRAVRFREQFLAAERSVLASVQLRRLKLLEDTRDLSIVNAFLFERLEPEKLRNVYGKTAVVFAEDAGIVAVRETGLTLQMVPGYDENNVLKGVIQGVRIPQGAVVGSRGRVSILEKQSASSGQRSRLVDYAIVPIDETLFRVAEVDEGYYPNKDKLILLQGHLCFALMCVHGWSGESDEDGIDYSEFVYDS